MRAGKLDKAGDISLKVGKLLADRRAQMLADLNDRNTRQLWAAIKTATRCHVMVIDLLMQMQ